MPFRLLAPALLLPGLLAAQDSVATKPDSSPFHRGQWGAQFIGLTSSIGVMKFTSPTRAWTLHLRIGGAHSEDIVDDTVRAVNSSASLDLSTSRRTYRPIARNVVAHHSFGLSLGFDHNASAVPGGSGRNGFEIGPFADVGATYLIVSHIGVGVRASAALRYGHSWSEAFSRTGHTWIIRGATAFEFLTTIYF